MSFVSSIACETPQAHCHVAAPMGISKLMLLGGSLNDLLVYDDVTKKLTATNTKHEVLNLEYLLAVKYLDGALVWFGYGTTTYKNDMYYVTLDAIEKIDVQKNIAARAGAAHCGRNSANDFCLVMFGGYHGEYMNQTQQFCMSTREWTSIATINTPSNRSAMASSYHEHRNSMFIHGGCVPEDISELWELRFADWTWHQHTNMVDVKSSSHGMCTANDLLYVHMKDNLYQYNPYTEQCVLIELQGVQIPSFVDGILVYHFMLHKIFINGCYDGDGTILYQIDVPHSYKHQQLNICLFKNLHHYADVKVMF